MKFSWKNIENWRSWKMRFFWGGHFEFFLLHICEKSSPFVWGNIFFCTMDVFFQNLGKDFILTNMHTTVFQVWSATYHKRPLNQFDKLAIWLTSRISHLSNDPFAWRLMITYSITELRLCTLLVYRASK